MLNSNGCYSANGTKPPYTNGNNGTHCSPPSGALVASKALMLTNGSGLYKVFSTESVLSLLHCLYCKKPYRDPRLLHCGHTYCLQCLVQMNRYSTIRCIKCNSLHTVTSHAVDTLPKNLFVADIQCIPTVEIDRGAAYKETLKSLEDLKLKLLDFSDKLDQSEEKLISLSEMKKIEVSEQISKIIEHIRLLEEEFHTEIDEFKNNRLSVLRSAPAEFKETNSNLLQFCIQSLDDMMRPDIKEEDVKEIYNRCEEHRRLWNETEIIFNSNYAIGEIFFQPNDTTPSKDIIGSLVQKFPQKLSAQRTSKGPVSISECCMDGDYIVIENTSKRNDINMTNWMLTHCVGSVRKISFKFPENFILKSKQTVKLWASSRKGTSNKHKNGYSTCSSSQSSSSSIASSPREPKTNGFFTNGHLNQHHSKLDLAKQVNQTMNSLCLNSSNNDIMQYADTSFENELIVYDIENWTCGSQEIFIRIENEFGEEKASFRKTK
ncbi:unnamed protein product [Brachionus calyciflorus]|uniref:RING-type domain-containing protein n=1 Tax=Brachionus calyciflorus TaxID=104777 RepID=A0A813M797_9BILA|nr:unnamed protein product [Brachionus calyciflorus]